MTRRKVENMENLGKVVFHNTSNGAIHEGNSANCLKCIKNRLEYLRGEIEAERISYGELAELQSLTKYIKPGDVQLLEWAGVPERRTT